MEKKKKLTPGFVCVRDDIYINEGKEIYQYYPEEDMYVYVPIRKDNVVLVRKKDEKGNYRVTSCKMGRLYAEAFISSEGRRYIGYRDGNCMHVSKDNIYWRGPVVMDQLPANVRYTGIDNIYVSEDGKVYQKTKEAVYNITTTKTKRYQVVTVNKQHYNVHHLVALAYVENPNGFCAVRFKDDDPSHISKENLEWFNPNPHIYEEKWRETCPKCGRVSNKNYIKKHKMCSTCYQKVLRVKAKKKEKAKAATQRIKQAKKIARCKDLTDRQRTVVSYFAKGFTCKEVASKMGCSGQNVRSLYGAAKKNAEDINRRC